MNDNINKRIKLVNDGDDNAVNELIQEFQLMIYSIISSYQLEYGDYLVSKEDLFQEGCIGLIEACKSYVENDNTKFSTYAFVVIERRIQRTFFRLLRPYREEFSFDKYEYLDRMECFKYDNVSDNKIKYNTNPNELLNELKYATELDKKIISMRIQNYSYKEIAKILNITTKKVDNRISRLKKIYKRKSIEDEKFDK